VTLKILALSLLLVPLLARAEVYTLGSSYSWDARPYDLDGAVEWHVDCGRSLEYIRANPSLPCVASSTLWPIALSQESFAAVSFQPVNAVGSTLWDDLYSIYSWVQEQPDATIVIHQSWPVPRTWEAVLHGPSDPSVTNRSLAYGYELVAWLSMILPNHPVRLTRSNEMLDRIRHDCQRGTCPLPAGFDEMFRDASGHMSSYGRYLQHNALRGAFGQPIGVQPPQPELQVPPEIKAYLDGVVAQYVPEPGGNVSLLAGAALLAGLSRARRPRRRDRPFARQHDARM